MTFLGFNITRTKAVSSVTSGSALAQLSAVMNRGWHRILESFAGAWQRNIEITVDNVTTHPTVFACVTLIASDVAKMRMRLVQQDENRIWHEVESPAFSPVLDKPNHFQDRIQFTETWQYSKLLWGNAYVLKIRDNRNVVQSEYVLDPSRVRPLVSPNGDVFYELNRDDLSRLPDERYVVPATEIIHDRWNCLFHPLVGLSPIYAAGAVAINGINIQNNSTNFFGTGSLPGGVLTAPGEISQPTADRLKAYFDENFSGENAGKVAVLGDGLKYEQMTMSAADSQLIEQLKWTAQTVAVVFHVPWHMVGGPMPSYNNVQALVTQYYSQCIQEKAEKMELCQDHGLGLTTGDAAAKRYGTEFDTDDLLRMDSATMMTTIAAGVGAGVMKPNEGRQRLNLAPVRGGDTPYLQQQNYSLAALDKRDSQADPFAAKPTATLPSAPAQTPEATDKALMWRYRALAIAQKRIEETTAAA